MAATRPSSRAGTRTSLRRRQRSVRVSVAVSLLGLATLAVLVTLPTQSPLWLSVGSVLALVLSWGALRMMWTEVLQSRRENAADRAAAASAYRDLFTVRAAEHAEFTTAMTERLAEAHLSRRELEGLVTQHQGRAELAEARLHAKTEALAAARVRVSVLEESVAVRQADEAVVELVSWEEQAGQKVQQVQKSQKGGRKPSSKPTPALKQA